MSTLREVFEVARRDFLQRARSKAFLITTALTVGLILVMAPILTQVIAEAEEETIGLVGAMPAGLIDAIGIQGERIDLSVGTAQFDDQAAGEEALRQGDVAVLVVGDDQLVWLEDPDLRLQSILVAARQALERDATIAELGLSPEEALRLLDPPVWEPISLVPPDPAEVPRMVVAQLGGFLLYMGIIIFGQFILMGVMEEKQNRVIEVILSRIPPTRLLAGKVLGIGALGLIQIVILAGAILAASTQLELPDIDLTSVGLSVFGLVIAWYILGFGLYAVLYGAMGATVSRQEDAQGAVMLPTLVLVAGYLIATFSAENPDGVVAVVGSMFPLTAPVVMPFRAAAGSVPWWQMTAAAGLVILTTWGMIRVGARVYSGAVLSLGKKVRLREAWRSARNEAA